MPNGTIPILYRTIAFDAGHRAIFLLLSSQIITSNYLFSTFGQTHFSSGKISLRYWAILQGWVNYNFGTLEKKCTGVTQGHDRPQIHPHTWLAHTWGLKSPTRRSRVKLRNGWPLLKKNLHIFGGMGSTRSINCLENWSVKPYHWVQTHTTEWNPVLPNDKKWIVERESDAAKNSQ